jgi:ABC-type sulfate transport system substrate-binding protein
MKQANDIDVRHDRGNLIPADCAKPLPDNSSPTSVILVRKAIRSRSVTGTTWAVPASR